MATFTYTPDNAAQADIEPRVLTSKFGDGYQQRVGDGINIRPRTFTLTFNTRTDAEMSPIVTFLETANGINSFDWTPPFGAAGKFVCRKWSPSKPKFGINNLSLTFEEVYE